MIRLLLLTNLFIASGCSDNVSTDIVYGSKGLPGEQTPVFIDTEGNSNGYYEYLPRDYSVDKKWPLLIYWNGANAISGNGHSEINNLLTQGLPKLINEGKHYPTIIISPMYPEWSDGIPGKFVKYILDRYKDSIDLNRIYMSGFSAGGGVTLKYASHYPEVLAAIWPVSSAIRYPESNYPSEGMNNLPTWFVHNRFDPKVESDRSIKWHQKLSSMGQPSTHRITIYESDSHYAWQAAYASEQQWQWLLSNTKDKKSQ